MPQEMKKVNGRWVVTGSPQSSDLVPFVKPKAAAPKPAGKPKPAAKPQPKPWWAKLGNDALYELKRLAAPPLQRNPLQDVQRALASPVARAVPQQVGLAVVGAVDNTNRMAYSLYQRHVQKKPKADASAGRAGETLDRYVDVAYRALGATPPSQMTPGQREADQTRRSLALNVGLAFVPGAGLGALAAKTGLGATVRGAGAWALNEVASNYLDDNTSGNVINAINQFSGANLPGAVNVGADDMVDAANKSLVPNALLGLGLGAAVGGGASAFRNIQRRTRAGRTVETVQRSRAAQEDAGLIEKTEDDSYRFTEQAKQPVEPAPAPAAAPAQAAPAASPMDEFIAANAAMEEQLGMRPPAAAAPEPAPIPSIENPTTETFGKAEPASLPEGDLDADLWDAEYDPSLPESDALGRVMDDLDDEELMVVAQGQGPVVEQVNQLVETRPPLEVNSSARLDMTAAPTANLAQPIVPFNEQWQALPANQLRSLASPDNSPELFSRIQGITGKEFEEFSKTDILDGLASFEADGITVLPNRLMPGQQMMRTAEIFTDPINLQYKDNVDAGGVQRQGSLEGVESWSTDAEGVIQVWTNPMDGKTYVVNGHNRLAAAKRLGIPSLRVEELLANTAEQARAQGAIANIASGGGTVFDAAKFLRDSGVTDPAQLKQMGVPLDSGFGAQGLALSRLPGNLFQDVVDGQLSLSRALALGGSQLSPEDMIRVSQLAAGREMTERGFAELVQFAGTAPKVADAPQGGIPGLDEWMQESAVFEQAEIAAKVRAELISSKNLFGKVAAKKASQKLQDKAGTTVDQGQALTAKDIAEGVLREFDRDKLLSGTPVNQLLGQAALEMKSGAKRDVLVKRILKQLEAAAEQAPPAPSPKPEAQPPAAPEPAILSAAERQALKNQALQKAIAGGEVRPPSTPIPELPDAPLVRADEAQAEIAAQSAPVIEIPAAAALRWNPDREMITAESLYSWASNGVPGQKQPIETVQQALEIVRAKNQRFDPDAVPGLDMDTARNDKAMGRSTPATQAVAAAYRQFYGVPEPAPVIRPGSKAAQAMADEVRLAVEYSKADALNRWDQEEGLRDAFDYEARSFDEKKDLGVASGYDEVPKIADILESSMKEMAQSDARLYRGIGESMGNVKQLLDELADPALSAAPVRPRPLRLAQAPEQPGFTLPEGLGRAAPRYGRATIAFQSDLDRAAYVLANDAVKPSKAAAKFREAVEAAGLSVADVVAHGKRVKASLKQAAKGDPGQIELPAQPWQPSRSGGTQRFAASAEGLEADIRRLEAELERLEHENRLEVTARMNELTDGLREIVGNDVRIRILDTYKLAEKSSAWGGGEGLADIAGMYQLWKDTIHLYRQFDGINDIPAQVPFDELIGTGFHESFHRIARLAMSDRDMAVLNTPLARLKASKAMEDWGSDQATIAYDELLTEAAARVFSARFKGQDPIRAILPIAAGITNDIPTSKAGKALYKAVETIAGALNKVYDLIERSYNLFQGRGFESISSVFNRAASGEMRNTIEELRLDRRTLEPRTMPGLTRASKISYWEDYNVSGDPIVSRKQRRSNFNQELFDFDSMGLGGLPAPSYTKAAQQRVRQQIEANNQAMDQIRRKAQQEGC